MDDTPADYAETINQVSALLAAAYLRLRFPAFAPQQLDSREIESAHGTAG